MSVDGPPPVHEKTRGSAAQTFRGLLALAHADIPVRVTTVLSALNVEHLDELAVTLAALPNVTGFGLDPCAGGSWRPSGLLSAVVLCPRPAPSTPRAALCSRWRTTPTAMRRSGNQWRSHPMAASTPVLKLSEIWLPGREPSIASTGKACDGVSRKIATPCADPATAAPWPDDAPAIAHPE